MQTDMARLIGAILLLAIMTRGVNKKTESQTYVHLIFDGIYLCCQSSKLLQYIRWEKPDLCLTREICIMVIHIPTQYFLKPIIDLENKYNF